MSATLLGVLAYLGKPVEYDQLEQVEAHLTSVRVMVKAYTRGQGFTGDEPADDLAAVIVSATARAVGNPTQTIAETLGTFSVRYGVFNGWTLPELAVLNTYRRRTA